MKDINIEWKKNEKTIAFNIEASKTALKNNFLDVINDTGRFKSNLENKLAEPKYVVIKDCKIKEISQAEATKVEGEFRKH